MANTARDWNTRKQKADSLGIDRPEFEAPDLSLNNESSNNLSTLGQFNTLRNSSKQNNNLDKEDDGKIQEPQEFNNTNIEENNDEEEGEGLEFQGTQKFNEESVDDDNSEEDEEEYEDEIEGAEEFQEEAIENEDSEDEESEEDANNGDPKSQWRDLKRQQSNIKKQLSENAPEDVTQALESTFRLGTYNLYCLAWKNLIDTYGLTFLYLIFHFVKKYIVVDTRFCHFVDPFSPPNVLSKKILEGKESRHYGWILIFLALLSLLIIILVLVFIILISPFALVVGWWKEFGDAIIGFFGGGGGSVNINDGYGGFGNFGGGSSGGGASGGSF